MRNTEKWYFTLLIKKSFTIFSYIFSHRIFIICVFIQEVNACNFRIIWKLLLIAMTNGLLKTFADSFISFGGIIFIPTDFVLSIFLKSCSASQSETFGRWLFTAVQFFDMLFSFMVLILSWLANDLQIISHYFPCNGWFSSAKAFYDIYVVVIEIENSYITSVTILFFSVNITPAFSRNLLFVRNGLINFRESLFVWIPFSSHY